MAEAEESLSKKVLPWIAPAVLAGTLVAGFVRAEGQINNNTLSIESTGTLSAERFLELRDGINDNEADIEALRLNQSDRRGTVALEIERLRIQQEVQADKLDEVLQLLRSQ